MDIVRYLCEFFFTNFWHFLEARCFTVYDVTVNELADLLVEAVTCAARERAKKEA
jgi:hypothetical protein